MGPRNFGGGAVRAQCRVAEMVRFAGMVRTLFCPAVNATDITRLAQPHLWHRVSPCRTITLVEASFTFTP